MTGDLREPATGDAFGAMLARCWAGGVVPGIAYEVVERDDGFVAVGDAVRYFAGPAGWTYADRWACERVAGRILDVGCGAGRHALHLTRGGHEVLGVDASPGAVDVATRRGVTAQAGTAERLPPDVGTFGTILLLGNNLGLLGGVEHARTVLTELAAAAGTGGRLLGTGLDPYRTTDAATLAYHRWNRERGRLAGQVRMRVREGRLATEWFDYLFASPAELADILRPTPWRLHHLYRAGPTYAVHLTLRRIAQPPLTCR